LPSARLGKNQAAWIAQPSATSPASVDSRLRASDDEPSGSIVGAEPQPHAAVGVDRVVGGHRTASAGDALVRDRPCLANLSGRRAHDERALAVDLDALGTGDVEPDATRIGAWRDDEVVLEPARAGVVDEVDTGIDLGESHSRIARESEDMPATAEQRECARLSMLVDGRDAAPGPSKRKPAVR